jgi:hypothetical protein
MEGASVRTIFKQFHGLKRLIQFLGESEKEIVCITTDKVAIVPASPTQGALQACAKSIFAITQQLGAHSLAIILHSTKRRGGRGCCRSVFGWNALMTWKPSPYI